MLMQLFIFVTTHSEFAPISFKYKVSALDFIDKTVSNAEFKQQLKQTLTFVNQKLEMLDDDEILCLKPLSLGSKSYERYLLFCDCCDTS